jgi:hypothetical protein
VRGLAATITESRQAIPPATAEELRLLAE